MSIKDAAAKCRRVAADLRERADRLDRIADEVDPPDDDEVMIMNAVGDAIRVKAPSSRTCDCISPVMRKYSHCPSCDLHVGDAETCSRCGALCPS